MSRLKLGGIKLGQDGDRSRDLRYESTKLIILASRWPSSNVVADLTNQWRLEWFDFCSLEDKEEHLFSYHDRTRECSFQARRSSCLCYHTNPTTLRILMAVVDTVCPSGKTRGNSIQVCIGYRFHLLVEPLNIYLAKTTICWSAYDDLKYHENGIWRVNLELECKKRNGNKVWFLEDRT